MGFGVSLILIAVGAVLVWAVDVSTSGVNLHTVGWILMVVGAVGFFLSLIFLSEASWYPGRRGRVVERDVVDDRHDVL